MINKKLQLQIRIKLWEKNLLLTDVAKELDYSVPFVSMVLSGKREIPEKFRAYLSNQLGITSFDDPLEAA